MNYNNLEIPEEFGRLEKHVGYDGRPTIVFALDNHASSGAQSAITKAYIHLALGYGLTFVGVEGCEGVQYTTDAKLAQVNISNRQRVYSAVDSVQHMEEMYDHAMKIPQFAEILGAELELFGYDNVSLMNRELRMISTATLLDESQASDSLLEYSGEQAKNLAKQRMRICANNMLHQMGLRQFAMMPMGYQHEGDFRDYMQLMEESGNPVNYYIFTPHDIEQTDEFGLRIYEKRNVTDPLKQEALRIQSQTE